MWEALKADKSGESSVDEPIPTPAFDVIMTPELERMLGEGMEALEMVRTTDEIRRGIQKSNAS
jgi:hypothetical protein